jgi:RNA polymerase sigma-70 factor (ECF subfamily)
MRSGRRGTEEDRLRPALLEAASSGDEEAFRLLVDPYRSPLQAHCYRMLGSLQDAEDALQDALLRAWRGLRGFDGRSPLRTWLYRIATNACLDTIARRPKGLVRLDDRRQGDADAPAAGDRLAESLRAENHRDPTLGFEGRFAAPELHYEQREEVELAFAAVLQLPPRQCAALILRDALSLSAKEVSESLGTTVASVNSALQRARKAVAERAPEESRQSTLRSPGHERSDEIVQHFIAAFERGDVDAIIQSLAREPAFVTRQTTGRGFASRTTQPPSRTSPIAERPESLAA